MTRLFTLLLLCLCTQGLLAQNLGTAKAVPMKVYEKLQSGEEFTRVKMFEAETKAASALEHLNKTLTEATVLTINKDKLKQTLAAQRSSITLNIPSIERGEIALELFRVDLIDANNTVKTSSSNGNFVSVETGLHYRGMVKGEENSIVAVSIFENDVMGMIVTEEGNMVLGKLENRAADDEYVLYNDADLMAQNDFSCNTPDDGRGYTAEELAPTADTRDAGDCVKIYIEVDKDIHDNKGGVQGATNYLTGVFNQCATLYANEGITYGISEILVWNTTSPYTGSGSSNFLNKFQNQSANTFVGDLAIFCNLASGDGGVAAGFSGLCNSNRRNSMSFAGLRTTYSNVPTYSWTVMVFTHELGHLMGSRHTHACVWNGNNTAIDGCAGYVEGNCSQPGYPSNGGTIMSYCHVQSVGINLNEGFGPQPGNVIRNKVVAASCLAASCGGGPTCDDGIQNGDETGVDCGGSNCPACPTNCTDNEIVVTINSDNYGSETTWTLTNGSGQTVVSGGPYGNNTTYTETLCLVNDCYDFTINDSYGDGICCAYGSGSYSVTGAGGTLASGGQFTSTETTNFCLGAAAPTCDDGVQNGNETGVDCGGSDCAACPTCDDGVQNGDETGVDCGGSNCPACPTCDDGVQNGDETGVDCGGSNCPACPTNPGCTDITFTLTFDRYASETSWQITNPAGQVIGSGSGYGNNQNSQTITASGCLGDGCYTLTMSDSYGDGICCAYGNGSYSITDGSGNVLVSGGQFGSSESKQFCLNSSGGFVNPDVTSNEDWEGLNIYPNPVKDALNIDYQSLTDGKVQITVLDILGRVVIQKEQELTEGQNRLQLNVNQLETGYHLVKVQKGETQFTQKFIKN